jgi:anaerobic ribonucleoside-triphosphate reductase activating protein
MRYSAIKTCDIHNGEGLRVSLWTQGCKGYCGETCHNKETWDECKGKEFTEQEYKVIKEELLKGQNLSIIGGEPLEEYNINDLTIFLKQIKEEIPHLNIWLWTHFSWEDIKSLELIQYINVIIDGKYVDELKCDYRKTGIEGDKWRGSSNQRILNVQESLNKNKEILYMK